MMPTLKTNKKNYLHTPKLLARNGSQQVKWLRLEAPQQARQSPSRTKTQHELKEEDGPIKK